MIGCLRGGLLASLLLVPGVAAAHPFDEVVQGAYLTLAAGQVQLELDVSPGPAVSDAVVYALDTNLDRRISSDEANAYAEKLLGQLILKVDGASGHWQLQRVSVPAYEDLRLQGDTLKIFAVAARQDHPGPHSLEFENQFRPAPSECTANVFLGPPQRWRYRVTGQQRNDDGRVLMITYVTARP